MPGRRLGCSTSSSVDRASQAAWPRTLITQLHTEHLFNTGSDNSTSPPLFSWATHNDRSDIAQVAATTGCQ
jgi:hypothetical protein